MACAMLKAIQVLPTPRDAKIIASPLSGSQGASIKERGGKLWLLAIQDLQALLVGGNKTGCAPCDNGGNWGDGVRPGVSS
jgi:hypothetical protein